MKIAVISDLHLERACLNLRGDSIQPSWRMGSFGLDQTELDPTAEVLVLAGNIHTGGLAFDWARRHFAIPTVIIGGNSEAHGHELFRTIAFNRKQMNAARGSVVFLERATWDYVSPSGERARFIGATLWTDFELYGTAEASMRIALERLADFKKIRVERGYKLRMLLPADTVRLHRATVAYLRRELSQPFAGLTVVVTHHAPSSRSISPMSRTDPLNPSFVSDLEGLIRAYAPALWVHGHGDASLDYMIERTRVISNPRGCYPDRLNAGFDPRFAVDLESPYAKEQRAAKRDARRP